MQTVVASQPVDRPACSAESRPAADPAPQPEARPLQGLQDRQAFGNLETLAQDKDLRHGKLHCRSAFLPITDHRSLAASGRRSVISDRWQVSYARAVSNTKISSEAARARSSAIPSARWVCTSQCLIVGSTCGQTRAQLPQRSQSSPKNV